MENYSSRSTLEILPDEILLEICKYLLNVDILQAFFGLNSRMVRMISEYCTNVSLYKTTISQSSYLYVNVLPKIGFHIRSLLIDNRYSLLQNDLFIKHFDNKMSILFPNLEKLILVGYRHYDLICFLDNLNNLNNLVEIKLDTLFDMNINDESIVIKKLFKSNNNNIKSILIDNQSTSLNFNDINLYTNIVKLRLNIKRLKDIPSLFAAIPNVNDLDIIIQYNDNENVIIDEIYIPSLVYLKNFQLKSIGRLWKFEELLEIVIHLPNIECISLYLCTSDLNLVYGNIVLSLLPLTIQKFHYAIYYSSELSIDNSDSIIASWPSSHPIMCFVNDDICFVHTLPFHFLHLSSLALTGKKFSSLENSQTGYNRSVKQFDVFTDKNLNLVKCFSSIAQCYRMTTLNIWMNNDDQLIKENSSSFARLPKLSQLVFIGFYPSSTVDIDNLSLILIDAPNLIRLDLPFDCLLRLLENEQISNIIRQRIKSLVISEATKSSQLKLNEEHIDIISSNLIGLRDLYVNLEHLTPSLITTSNEIMPLSMESMIQRILSRFKDHKLISLDVDIQPSEKIEKNPKQWLQDNTILCQQQFDAYFDQQLKRLMIWM